MLYAVIIMMAVVPMCKSTILFSHGLPPGTKKLHRLLVDNKNGNVYIGATNVIYIRDSHLRAVNKVMVGPRNDSLNCQPNPSEPCNDCRYSVDKPNVTNPEDPKCAKNNRVLSDSVIKNLILNNAKNELIVCSNLYYGYCLKISLIDYSIIEALVPVPVVSNSLNGESVALIAPSGETDETLYVGATRDIEHGLPLYKDQSHMFAVRNLQNFDIAHYDRTTDSASFIDVIKELRDSFPVNFKYGFSFNGYSYFIATHKMSQTNEETATFMFRVCHNDPQLHSFIEIKMDCLLQNTDYNSLVTGYVTRVGSSLAESMKISKEDDVFFGIFASTLLRSFVSRDDSTGICVYALQDIAHKFDSAASLCASGIDQTGPSYIVEPRPCQQEQTYACGKTKNYPLSGSQPLTPKASYIFSGLSLTSVAIKRTSSNKFTVGYLGTHNGMLLKVSFASNTTASTFTEERISLEGRSIMKDMFFDSNEENLYMMTEYKVLKVSLYNCSKYQSCDECTGSKDPHCGWCSLENICTVKTECAFSNMSYGWLPYNFLACPAFTDVVPNKIAENRVKKSQLILQLNTDHFGMYPLKCELTSGDTSITSTGFSFVGGVNCTPFTEAINLPNNKSVASIEADLWIKVIDERWISSKVMIYDCTRLLSCKDCTGGNQPCVWCMKSNQCINDRLGCKNSSAILSSATSLEMQQYSSSDQVGDFFCPAIEMVDDNYMVPSGNPKQVNLDGLNLMDYHTTKLRCKFDYQGGIFVNASYKLAQRIIQCESTTLSYPDQKGFVDVPVQVLWDGNKLLDNPKNAKVRVYKCEHLASDCGNCTLLSQNFRCGWCDDTKCTLPEGCSDKAQPGKWLTGSDICPHPQIKDIFPVLGPYLGGTFLTIQGTNLGKKLSDVQQHVLVAGIRCSVRTDLYKPPSSLVCKTEKSNEEKQGKVKITINGQASYEAISSQVYSYQDPILVEFAPKNPQGPVSGGTHVTITGQYLDMGSRVNVSIEGKPCEVVRRENTKLEFITSAQPAPINGQVKVTFDESEIITFPTTFKFITNPRVTTIHPQAALLTGGSMITVNGSDLHSSTRPVFFIEKDLVRSESNCVVKSKKILLCPLPSLADFNLHTRTRKRATDIAVQGEDIALLNYGLEVDGWHADIQDLSYDIDLDLQPIKIYQDPVIHVFIDSIKTFSEGLILEIVGENLQLFNLVPGLEVTVGNTSCQITEITEDRIAAVAPSSPNIIIDGKSKVVVNHGNLHVSVGYVQYAIVASSNVGVILGVIFGVIIPIVLIAVVIFFLKRHRKSKKGDAVRVPSPRNNGVVEKGNIYSPTVEKEESKPSEEIPLKEMPCNAANNIGPVGSDGEEEEEVASDKPFQLSDFLERIRDSKLRSNVQEVIVPLDRLDMKEMIGRGNFGCVYIADLRADHEYNACRVAVKTLQGERLEQHTVEAFLKEGVIMKNFNHPHVLKLLGVCVDHQENPMVILPYMANGDLRTYVKDKKKNFTARQLLHLAQQVAEGMAYLSSLNFVHRDLAARNCMIDELDTVKVADFGLTRDLFEKQYFSTNLKEKRGKMPIKWMALESLEEFVFTTKSDVWSFGVLMWELMTRGVTPYPDVDIFDVRNYLASGRRLRKPKYCPENIYSIMLECWHADPDIRPSFIDLVNKIELLLNPPKRRIQEETSNEPMYMNIRKANSIEYLKPVDGSTTEEPESPIA